MQAITIKYLPATHTKGSRFKATAAAGSITLGYDHALNTEGNVKAAVSALLAKLGWTEANGYTVGWAVGQMSSGVWAAVALDSYSTI
ncbi:hypothetical protein [Pseudomonas fildesensis]|uniref:Uncharacterized protein n=1 Tax=Pseudomonas fildesensis TaxID=1674920 RepID=A0A0J8FS44_9PSED|nr:hypothetical protein [Pseudomonas fildesensis]KMT53045.1 hypothetical protein ACR52_24125 [Pseudomonas fildesensis]